MSNKRPVNILVVSNPRSGSTLLIHMLDGHSQYNCSGELFHPMYFERGFKRLIYPFVKWKPEIFVLLRSLFMPKPFERGIGFKVFEYQVDNLRQFVRRFHKKGYQVVFLERKNLLKQAISKYIASEKDVWVIRNESQQITDIFKLDPSIVAKYIDILHNQQHINQWALKGLNPIYVQYEDDLATPENQQVFWTNFCKTLQINQEPFKSTVVKSDKRNDADRIENFNEIIEYLNTHGYEKEVAEYFAY